MSEDEKAASIGKLMLEWKSSNEKMGAIEAEFLRHSEVFKSLSSLLARSRRTNADRNVLDSQDLDKGIAAMPTPEALSRLVEDARMELKRFEDLSSQKRQLGL
jgi:hypothetical protein